MLEEEEQLEERDAVVITRRALVACLMHESNRTVRSVITDEQESDSSEDKDDGYN